MYESNIFFFLLKAALTQKRLFLLEKLTYSARYRCKIRYDVLDNKWKTVYYNQLTQLASPVTHDFSSRSEIYPRKYRENILMSIYDGNLRDVRYVWKFDYRGENRFQLLVIYGFETRAASWCLQIAETSRYHFGLYILSQHNFFVIKWNYN